MMDLETFLTTRDVIVNDVCQPELEPEKLKPGPLASLSRSEGITLALFGPWVHVPRERAFDRDAQPHLREAFPPGLDHSQFHRLQRTHHEAIPAFALFLVQLLQVQRCAYEVLDSTAAVTREAKRRGLGWLASQADIGRSHRMGWDEGFHLLLCVTAQGVRTGFGFGSASTHDQHLAATLFAARQTPSPPLRSCGLPAQGSSVADKGFAGERPRLRWHEQEQVNLVTPPHQRSKRVRWPKALRRWLASLRQMIETVNDNVLNTFCLARERPQDVTGFHARLAANVALHHVCIWLHLQLDCASLAFTALLEW